MIQSSINQLIGTMSKVAKKLDGAGEATKALKNAAGNEHAALVIQQKQEQANNFGLTFFLKDNNHNSLWIRFRHLNISSTVQFSIFFIFRIFLSSDRCITFAPEHATALLLLTIIIFVVVSRKEFCSSIVVLLSAPR